jgi:rubredoxin
MRGDEEQYVDLTICPRCRGPREVRQADPSAEGQPTLISFTCPVCAYEVTPAIPQPRPNPTGTAPVRSSGRR